MQENTRTTVYLLSKNFKTKSVKLGEHASQSDAVKAMLDYEVSNSKRGEYYYTISEVSKEERPDGLVMYCTTISLLADRSRWWRYSKEAVGVMVKERIS